MSVNLDKLQGSDESLAKEAYESTEREDGREPDWNGLTEGEKDKWLATAREAKRITREVLMRGLFGC